MRPFVPSTLTVDRSVAVVIGCSCWIGNRWFAVSMNRSDHLIQRHALVPQPLWIDIHLQLPVALSPDRDVRDSRDTHELRCDRPPREHPHIARRDRLGSHADDQDAIGRRKRLEHAWRLRNLGVRERLREALGHDLARLVDARPGLEDQQNARQSLHRLRADVLEERDPVEQVLLERNRDQLFDLLRGQAEGLRLHLHGGRREVRQDLHGRLAHLSRTDDENRRRAHDDEQPEPQARANDLPEHG